MPNYCAICGPPKVGPYKDPENPELRLCQACRNRLRRAARGLQKPGPVPDPSKPRSRHGTQREDSPNYVPKGKKLATETHCANDHPWTEENTYWRTDPNDGVTRRVCRICFRKAQRKSKGLPPIPDDIPFNTRHGQETHCPRNHEYTPENTYLVEGKWRRCRKCTQINRLCRDYGLSPEKIEELLDIQENRCPVCRQEFVETSHVDHDHSCCSGKTSCGKCVRGLLCNNCNNGLGRFEDDVDRLQAAIDYLKNPLARKLASVLT